MASQLATFSVKEIVEKFTGESAGKTDLEKAEAVLSAKENNRFLKMLWGIVCIFIASNDAFVEECRKEAFGPEDEGVRHSLRDKLWTVKLVQEWRKPHPGGASGQDLAPDGGVQLITQIIRVMLALEADTLQEAMKKALVKEGQMIAERSAERKKRKEEERRKAEAARRKAEAAHKEAEEGSASALQAAKEEVQRLNKVSVEAYRNAAQRNPNFDAILADKEVIAAKAAVDAANQKYAALLPPPKEEEGRRRGSSGRGSPPSALEEVAGAVAGKFRSLFDGRPSGDIGVKA